MKAGTFLVFYSSFLILAVAGIGLYQNNQLPGILEYMHIGLMVCIVALGIYQGYLALRSRKNDQPADDEMSVKILHRAAMISYLASLNAWAVIIYLASKKVFDPFLGFGTGILIMALVFAASWIIMKSRRYA